MATNPCRSPRNNRPRLFAARRPLIRSAGRHGTRGRDTPLILRRPCLPPPVRTTIRQTTVIHLHQTVLRPARREWTGGRAAGQPAPPRPAFPAMWLDPARPTRAAHTLLRLFSQTVVRRELRPFYREMVHSVLREERERGSSRPEQTIVWIAGLFGRQAALRVLSRLCLTREKGARGFLWPGRSLRRTAGGPLCGRGSGPHSRRGQVLTRPRRYGWRERPAAGPALRPPEPRRDALPAGRDRGRPPGGMDRLPAAAEKPAAVPAARLSGDEFRALVRSVADALGRQTRQESLRRGGAEI